jgi:formylmethanofuran dehydrogenase subunit E
MKMMLSRKATVTALLAFPLAGFAQDQSPAAANDILARVVEFHGTAGVFAVAEYRIGARALTELQEKRGSFRLDVTHHTPFEVQWSCIADGIQAATGVSAGKLNLRLLETTPDKLETVIKDNRSGKILSFRLRPEFLSKYLDTPEARQAAAARDVLKLPDSAIFTIKEAAIKR